MRQNNLYSFLRGPRAIAAAALTVATMAASPATAEDIQTVEIGSAGPNQRLPLGKEFFLKGAAGTAQQVNVVFVRTSFAPFGLGAIPDCAAVQQKLGKVRPGVFVRDKLSPGPTDGDTVWTSGNAGSYRVLLAAGWARPEKVEEKEPTYQVRVGGDSSFFRPGAQYCMFVYKTEQPSLDGKGLLTAADTLRDTLSACKDDACENKALAVYGEGAAAFIEAAKKKEWEACPPGEDGKPAKSCGEAVEKALKDVQLSLQSAAVQGAASKQRSVRAVIDEWPKLLARKSGGTASVLGGAPVPASDPFARFVLGVLDRHHEVKSGGPATKIEYASRKDSVAIAYLKVGEALDTIEVADGNEIPAKPDPGKNGTAGTKASVPAVKREVLKPNLAKMFLPDSTVSLLDIFRLARGRITVGSKDERIHEAYATDADRSPERLKALKERLVPLVEVFTRAKAANEKAAGAATPTIPGVDVYKALGEWWPGVTTDECPAWQAAVNLKTDPCGGTLLKELHQPFEALNTRIGNLLDASVKMADARAELEKVKGAAIVKPTATVSVRVAFEAKSWVTQFITPTVGFAAATSPAEAIPILYGGIKVYPWPNPVDEPMWTNGAIDFSRVIALEVGLGTTSKGIGQDGRFSGPGAGAFPPILLGGSLQLLPYATFSMGAVLLEAKRTTLPDERPRFFPSFYAGLSIDANVFDAVAGQFATGRNASTNLTTK